MDSGDLRRTTAIALRLTKHPFEVLAHELATSFAKRLHWPVVTLICVVTLTVVLCEVGAFGTL